MEWEEAARRIHTANERRNALEKYIMQHPNQAGDEYRELLDLREQIASLIFNRDFASRSLCSGETIEKPGCQSGPMSHAHA